MTIWSVGLALLLSYLAGAIPFGWFVVKIVSGKDVRQVESGRTGGTNAMRAAGFVAGLLTVILDAFKGFSTGWIVNWLTPGSDWMLVAAPLIAILGHNYSVFLLERSSKGKLQLRGGAGGAPCLGGALAVGGPIMVLIIPFAALVFALVGYASVTTISVAVAAMLISIIQAAFFGGSWVHVLYGVISIGLVMWSLRPNLKRLQEGTERVVGLRAYLRKRAAAKKSTSSKDS